MDNRLLGFDVENVSVVFLLFHIASFVADLSDGTSTVRRTVRTYEIIARSFFFSGVSSMDKNASDH